MADTRTKIAVLRDLAEEIRAGQSDLAQAVMDTGSFYGTKTPVHEILDARADELQRSLPTDTRRECTCVGSCGGPEHLGPGWRCCLGKEPR